MSRRWPAPLAALVGLGVLVSAAPATAGAPAAPLHPNLATRRPATLSLEERPGGRRFLHFANTVENVGIGPFELDPRKEDCDGDEDLENDRTAYQIVYLDDGDGVFEPADDTSMAETAVACFRFHEEHGHWHVDGFARYRLRSNRTGEVVARRSKVSFCAVDSVRKRPDLPGSPVAGAYRSCEADVTQGISIGWADVYSAFIPGQSLVITAAPPGRYCLGSTADPRNVFLETDDGDNRTGVPLRLRRHSLRRLSGRC